MATASQRAFEECSSLCFDLLLREGLGWTDEVFNYAALIDGPGPLTPYHGEVSVNCIEALSSRKVGGAVDDSAFLGSLSSLLVNPVGDHDRLLDLYFADPGGLEGPKELPELADFDQPGYQHLGSIRRSV